MPSYIVSRASAPGDLGLTRDRQGAGVVKVTEPTAEAARISGADQLGCSPHEVTVTRYEDPYWQTAIAEL